METLESDSKWYLSTALIAEVQLGQFWPDLEARPKGRGLAKVATPDVSEKASDAPGAKQGETLVAPPTRGRKKGSGSYDEKDEPLLKRMLKLFTSGAVVSVEAAARKLAPKATGGGSEASKRDRLAKKFRAKFGSDIARKKSD